MNTQTKKLVIIDNRISFFNAVERYVEKLAKVLGNEPARLCYPHSHVTDGLLNVVSIEGKNHVTPIHGVTLINTQNEDYHTVRNGWKVADWIKITILNTPLNADLKTLLSLTLGERKPDILPM